MSMLRISIDTMYSVPKIILEENHGDPTQTEPVHIADMICLIKVGCWFGELGDAFHNWYMKANYAYKFGLYIYICHAALWLSKSGFCVAV